MNKQDNKLEANPMLTINYLANQVKDLSHENAMLKAIIQELNTRDNETSDENNR
ncbi:hypothetical protein [Staphylococcus hyicus]|uniref:hypothetical protein n=1 Tax=Staphylococcus hyicus TaxID=1284 RepID=UPI0037367C31